MKVAHISDEEWTEVEEASTDSGPSGPIAGGAASCPAMRRLPRRAPLPRVDANPISPVNQAAAPLKQQSHRRGGASVACACHRAPSGGGRPATAGLHRTHHAVVIYFTDGPDEQVHGHMCGLVHWRKQTRREVSGRRRRRRRLGRDDGATPPRAGRRTPNRVNMYKMPGTGGWTGGQHGTTAGARRLEASEACRDRTGGRHATCSDTASSIARLKPPADGTAEGVGPRVRRMRIIPCRTLSLEDVTRGALTIVTSSMRAMLRIIKFMATTVGPSMVGERGPVSAEVSDGRRRPVTVTVTHTQSLRHGIDRAADGRGRDVQSAPSRGHPPRLTAHTGGRRPELERARRESVSCCSVQVCWRCVRGCPRVRSRPGHSPDTQTDTQTDRHTDSGSAAAEKRIPVAGAAQIPATHAVTKL